MVNYDRIHKYLASPPHRQKSRIFLNLRFLFPSAQTKKLDTYVAQIIGEITDLHRTIVGMHSGFHLNMNYLSTLDRLDKLIGFYWSDYSPIRKYRRINSQ